jgi:hypothetical protein
MNHLSIKRVVCIISPESLEALRQARPGQLRERVWREIRLSANAEKITISLANVDEEAATGGYCNAREASSSVELAWADLEDLSGLEKRIELEPMLVARHILEMVTHVRNVSTQVHAALAI